MLPQTIALLSAIAYALTFILSRRGLPYSTPLTITLVTLIVQTAGLWTVLFVTTGVPDVAPLALLVFVVAGVLQFVIRQLTYIGIDRVGAALSGPLRATVPFWAAVVAVLFLGEHITFGIATGTLLVFAGILLISWRAGESVKHYRARHLIFPLLAAIIGGILYPVRRYALTLAQEPLFFGAVVGLVALVTVLFYMALPTTRDKLVWDRRCLVYFFFTGLFETIGLLLVLYALTLGPVVIVSPIVSTLPLWVVLGSKLLLRDLEKITPRIWLGALFVVLGTIAISLAKP